MFSKFPDCILYNLVLIVNHSGSFFFLVAINTLAQFYYDIKEQIQTLKKTFKRRVNVASRPCRGVKIEIGLTENIWEIFNHFPSYQTVFGSYHLRS